MPWPSIEQISVVIGVWLVVVVPLAILAGRFISVGSRREKYPDYYTEESRRVLRKELKIGESTGNKIGSTLNVRKPSRFSGCRENRKEENEKT